MMCVDYIYQFAKATLGQSHFMNAILNSGKNPLLVQLEAGSN